MGLTFRLPGIEPPPRSGVHRVRRHTVVVVEPDAEARRAVVEALSLGYQVREATTALEAAELLGAGPPPDAVVCSARLPDIDGLTFVKKLRLHHELRHVPFVFLTAHEDAGEMARAIAAGARHCIEKPVDAEELLRKVARSVA